MAFLRFETTGNDGHEWGFQVPDGFIPAIGDTVNLWYGEPDCEGEDRIQAKVIKREWGFASDFAEGGNYEIWFTVRCKKQVPKGCVADSTEWPSKKGDPKCSK